MISKIKSGGKGGGRLSGRVFIISKEGEGCRGGAQQTMKVFSALPGKRSEKKKKCASLENKMRRKKTTFINATPITNRSRGKALHEVSGRGSVASGCALPRGLEKRFCLLGKKRGGEGKNPLGAASGRQRGECKNNAVVSRKGGRPAEQPRGTSSQGQRAGLLADRPTSRGEREAGLRGHCLSEAILSPKKGGEIAIMVQPPVTDATKGECYPGKKKTRFRPSKARRGEGKGDEVGGKKGGGGAGNDRLET